jgi:hypothetical protein
MWLVTDPNIERTKFRSALGLVLLPVSKFI